MRRALLCVVGAGLGLTLSGCAGVHLIGGEDYEQGYDIGVRVRTEMPEATRKEKREMCVMTADATAEEFGWDSDTRFDFLVGCHDAVDGKKRD